jgi:DNA-damage-inducible protein J
MSTVTVRVDEDTKTSAAAVLADIGLDVSTAVRVFLRQVVLRGQMPVELLQDPFYGQSNQAALKASLAQLESGQTVTHTIDELQAFE